MATSIEVYIHNPIKRHIIGEIMKRGKLKYSELMPPDTDNVLFNYHLQHLVKNGLLCKENNIYSFTPDGWKATSHLTYEGLYFQKFVCRFRMYIIDGDKILLQQRAFSPFKGDTTGLSSKVVYGTPAKERASLRIKEKTGLTAKMEFAGTIRTIISDTDKEILDDSIYFIMYATRYTGTLLPQDDNGNPLGWYSFDEAIKLEKENTWSGEKTVEVLKRFKAGNYDSFAFEEYITAASL
jgi:hypothetical protein